MKLDRLVFIFVSWAKRIRAHIYGKMNHAMRLIFSANEM